MMTLLVSFDSNGLERIGFYRLREQLLNEGRQFDATTLRHVPYEQLILCGIRNAGAARCSLELIRTEKVHRRTRFQEMSPDRLATVKRYVQIEGMDQDIERHIKMRESHSWESLSVLQKIWHKLTCIHNHLDAPGDRLRDAESLFFRAGNAGILSLSVATKFVDLIGRLITHPFDSKTPEAFSMFVAGYAEEILQHMPTSERRLCARELLIDYYCTSDCFQPPTNNQS